MGCFQTNVEDKNHNSKVSDKFSNNNKKSVSDILKEFQGGTIDLRNQLRFSIEGEYTNEKLLKTQITIKGDGKELLLSNQAFALKSLENDSFSINKFKNFSYFVIGESYNGNSVQTKVNSNKLKNIKYRLKL